MRLFTGCWRLAGAAAAAAGLMILASGCGTLTPHQASGVQAPPRPSTATTAPSPLTSTRPPAPTPSTSQPGSAATPVPTTGDDSPPADPGPHFTTAQAAITYLASAYNNDDTTAMHAVTDAQAFTSLQAMRSSDTDMQLTSCLPRQQGDYECTVHYNGPVNAGNPSGDRTAMLIAAPAANPGWYMYRFIEGCD